MTDELSPGDRAKKAAAEAACDLVRPGMALGLGTGSTALFMIRRLGERVLEEGLEITGVPTSSETAALAREAGLTVVTLDETPRLDMTIDGADEADGALDLIKGGGGALLYEKIVAAASARMVVIAGADKLVDRLGAYPLPLEVIAFGARATRLEIEDRLAALGYDGAEVAFREANGQRYRTDEGNLIADCRLGAIADPRRLSAELLTIPGVVETGLFLGMAQTLILGREDGTVEFRERSG